MVLWDGWTTGLQEQAFCEESIFGMFGQNEFLVDTFGHVGSCLTWSVMRNGVDEKKNFGGLTKIGGLVLEPEIAYVKIVLVGTRFSESRFFDVAS